MPGYSVDDVWGAPATAPAAAPAPQNDGGVTVTSHPTTPADLTAVGVPLTPENLAAAGISAPSPAPQVPDAGTPPAANQPITFDQAFGGPTAPGPTGPNGTWQIGDFSYPMVGNDSRSLNAADVDGLNADVAKDGPDGGMSALPPWYDRLMSGVINAPNAFVRNAANTITGGLADKAEAGANSLINDTSFSDELDRSQRRSLVAKANSPLASDLGGGAGIAGQAALMPESAVGATAYGAGIGASQGYGNARGDFPQETSQAILPTVLGAFGGAAAPTRVPIVPQLGEPTLADALPGVASGPARRAAAYVAGRIPQVSDPTIAAAADAGKPVILAQRAGTSGQIALGSLARRPGTTGDALTAYATDPATGVLTTQPTRLQADFHAATGIDPVAASGDMEALTQRLRNGPAREAYTKALSSPDPVWNDNLAALAQRPVVQKAMAAASTSLKNAGVDPTTVGLAIDPATGAPVVSNNLAEATAQLPTAQAWDLTKKVLGNMVERDQFGKVVRSGGAGILNGDIATASSDLTGELRNTIPGYGDALDKSGDYLGLQKAFDDGSNHIAATAITPAAVGKYVSNLSPAEKTAYAGGVANRLNQMADNGKLTPRTYSTPAFKAKLTAAVGEGPAKQIVAGAQQETAITSSLHETLPNSGPSTAKYSKEMADQDEIPAWVKHGSEFVVNSAIPHVGPGVAAAKLGMGLVGKVPQLISKPFQMSTAARNAAGQLLLSPDLTPEQILAMGGVRKPTPIVPQINVLRVGPTAVLSAVRGKEQ